MGTDCGMVIVGAEDAFIGAGSGAGLDGALIAACATAACREGSIAGPMKDATTSSSLPELRPPRPRPRPRPLPRPRPPIEGSRRGRDKSRSAGSIEYRGREVSRRLCSRHGDGGATYVDGPQPSAESIP